MPRNRAGIVNAAIPVHLVDRPIDVNLGALGPRPAEETTQAISVGIVGVAQQVQQHQSALALEQIATDLLAILAAVADQIQQIVLDLKSDAEVVSETVEAVEVCTFARRDQRTDAARMDEAVPA